MSLVAYDSSDESDEEILKQEKTPISIKSSPVSGAKKQRESVKITIPSLKQFEEENVEVPEKKPKFQSGSGLFSMLPPPKNSSTLSKPGFVPYVLKSKKGQPSSSSKSCDVSTPKLEKSHKQPAPTTSEHDSDDDISHGVGKSSEDTSYVSKDFFSLEDSTKNKFPIVNYSLSDYASSDISAESSSNSTSFTGNQSGELSCQSTSSENDSSIIQKQTHKILSSSFIEPVSDKQLEGATYSHYQQIPLTDAQIDSGYQPVHSSEYYSDSLDESVGKESLLNDKEFLKLQGRRKDFENINFIDVNAADQLTDKNEWLMKSLTEESTYRPSRKKHNMPTQQQKRKHQITYLAFQAKEREMDLKNQWGLNSRTRRETQAKYGF